MQLGPSIIAKSHLGSVEVDRIYVGNTIVFQKPVTGVPEFTTHPASQTIDEGLNAVFTSAATGLSTPTYQYQVNDGTGWVNIAASEAATLTVVEADMLSNGYQFRVRATNSEGSTFSNPATLTITQDIAFTTYFRDSFTEATDTNLSAHSPDVDPAGNGWTNLGSDGPTSVVVKGGLNYVDFEPGTADDSILFDTGQPNQILEFDFNLRDTNTNRILSFRIRRTDASNFYSVRPTQNSSPGQLSLQKTLAGVTTTITTVTAPWLRGTNPARMMIVLTGTNIKAYLNGVLYLDNDQSEITGTGFVYDQEDVMDNNRLLSVMSRSPYKDGTVRNPVLLASPATGKRLRFFLSGFTAEIVGNLTPGKSAFVTVNGNLKINLDFVSAVDYEDGVRIECDLQSPVLGLQSVTLTLAYGAITGDDFESKSVVNMAVVNKSTISSQIGVLSNVAAHSSTAIDVSLTVPAGVWGTLTNTAANFRVWATGGYGLVTVSSVTTITQHAATAIVRLNLSRTMHQNEFVDLEMLPGAIVDSNNHTVPEGFRVWRNINMAAAAAPPATTTKVSSGRSEITLAVAKPVVFYLDTIPAIVMGDTTTTVTSSGPAEGLIDAFAAHGAWLNPATRNTQPYDARAANFNAALQLSYPATVSKFDSLIKARSANSVTLDGASVSHPNPIEWYGYYQFVDTMPAATEFSPPAFGYDGSIARPTIVPDIDGLLADLPSLAFASVTGTPPTTADTLRRLAQPNQGRVMGGSSFHRYTTPIYFQSGDGYGREMSSGMAAAHMLLMSDTSAANKRQLATWLIHHGIQLYYGVERTAKIANNGGHEQGFIASLVMALQYTGLGSQLSNLREAIGMNELQQTFLWDQSDVDQINNRTSHFATSKTVTIVNGAQITFLTPDGNFEVENQLTRFLLTDGVGEWEVVGHTRFSRTVTLDSAAHGLAVDDVIWFKLPFPIPTIGTPDWALRHSDQPLRRGHHYQTYRNSNIWSTQVMLVESLGLMHLIDWPAWQAECRAANNDPDYLAPGYRSPARHETAFAAAFWAAHNVATKAIQDAADTTGPIISSATSVAASATSGTGTVTTDEGNGTLFVSCTASATTPSYLQIIAGQDHTGAVAAFATSQAVTTSGSQSVTATGLTTSTTYYLHFAQRDLAGNASNLESSPGFTP